MREIIHTMKICDTLKIFRYKHFMAKAPNK